MIVVSNTSPITNLAAIGQLGLLRDLYQEIQIPEGVWEELMSEVGSWPGRDEVKTATWIKRHPVVNHALFRRLHRDLHRGEAETITLAVEMKAELTLIDDADGRRTAQEYGVTTTGLVGVLLTGKEVGLIKNVKPHLDTLRGEAGFYLSERVYRVALDLADET